MAFDEATGLVNRLLARAQALSALTAHLRLLDPGSRADPALRPRLERVVDLLGARELAAGLSAEERSFLVSFARSYLRQALELVEQPERAGAWSHEDPVLLQAQGSASTVVASLFARSGVGTPDARILDVGTGVGGLATAFCRTYPRATVVGVDPWEPALALARRNVAEAGLEGRITLLPTPVERLEDAEGFDLVWLPAFFIPESVLDRALENVFRLARPGATVVVGTTGESDDELAAALDELMTVRSGGTPLTPAEAAARLELAGFCDVREIEPPWKAPLRLVAGTRRASPASVSAVAAAEPHPLQARGR